MKTTQSTALAPRLTAFIILLILPVAASAANWAWSTSPATANFSGANWTSGTTPGTATGTPATADSLFFGTSTITNLNNDDSAFTFAGLTFNAGASSFALTNNAFTLGGDITDNSTNLEVINPAMALSATRNFNVTSGGSLTIGGAVSGATFGVTKIGAGTMTLTNNNTYTGATAVNAGTLLADFSSLATATNVVSASSALTLGGGTFTIKGKPSASTAQTNNGTTFTGNTASSLVVNQNSATAVNISLGGLTRNSGSAVDITLPTTGAVVTTTTTTSGSNKINGNGVAYSTVNGGTTWLTNSASGTSTLGALPNGSYSVDTFAASSDADIQNNDSPAAFTNNTVRFNVASKTLTLNSSGVSQITAGGILVTPTGTGSVIASAGGSGYLTPGATGKEIIVHNYADLTISAPIANNAASASVLTIGGTGTTTVSGANLHTGGTVINKGVTKAGASTAGVSGPFGPTNASLTIAAAGTLDLNGFNVIKGVVTGSGTITNSSATTATFTAGNGNVTANLGSMLVVGNMQLELSGVNWNNANGNSGLNGNNTHTGGTLLSNGNAANWRFFGVGFGTGTLTFNNGSYFIPSGQAAGAYPMTNAIQMLGNGLVNEDTTSGATQGWSGPWTGTGTMTFNTGHAMVYGLSGDLSAFQGTISVNTPNAFLLTSASNTNASQAVINLLANGANFQYTGGANKTVLLGDLTTTGNPGTATVKGTVAGTTTWQIGSKNLSSTFGGTIVDNGTALSAVTKVGTGIWTLTNTCTYTGPTAVTNGLLFVNAPGSLASGSAVTVYGPGGLGGNGTINGPVTFTNNAVYTNGTGATLTCAGGLTLNNGGVLNFGLGTASDSIAVSGTFANNATTTPVTINIKNLAGFTTTTYNLITGGSIANTNNFVLGSVPSGYTGVLQSDGANLQVVISLSALPTAWWRGSANGNWNNPGTYNWNTDQASGINAGNYPSQPTDVHFSANSAANLNTTLGQDFTINTLTFDTAQSASIGGANALTVNNGITNGAAAGVNVISNASVVLGLDQTWQNNSVNTLTVSAAVSGAHALTTAGNVVLSGNNSYGATTITGGTLQIGAGGTSGALGSGNVANNGSLNFNRSGSLAVAGVISGAGSLTNSGSGTVTLNAAATYTGNTVINAGTIQLGAANAVPGGPGNGNVVVNGTLDLNTRSELLNGLTGSGSVDTIAGGTPTLSVGSNDVTSTFSGLIKNTSGTLALTKVGAGTSILAGTDSYSGQTTISTGTLQFNGSPAMSPSSVLFLASGATLALHADADATFTPASIATLPSDPTSGSDTTSFTIDVNNVTAGANKTMTLTGSIAYAPTSQSNRGLDQTTLYVAGGNGYTLSLGAITGANNGTSTTHAYDVASGLNLKIASWTQPGSAASSSLTVQDAGNMEVVGAISRAANRTLTVNLNGAGAFTLAGGTIDNGGSGSWTFNLASGTLNANNATSLRGSLVITGGALGNTSGSAVTLTANPSQQWNADFVFSGTSDLNLGSGAVVMNSPRAVTVNANTLTVGGIISDGGNAYGLTKNGNGTLLLTGATTYTGDATVSAGTLGLSSAKAGTGNVTAADGTTLLVIVSGTNQLSPATLTFGSSGAVTNSFSSVASTTVAPVNASSLVVNSSLKISVVSGNLVAGQTYPLIAYGSETIGGSVSLGSLPAGISGTLNDNGIGLISLTVTSVAPEIWKGAVNGTWTIGGPLNWSFASITTNYFDGSTVRFDDTASGTTTITNIGAVSPSSTTVSNSTKLYSFSGGSIGGSGSLTKDGNGTLILSSTNTYSGGTTIANGTLQLGDGTANQGVVAGDISDNGNLVFNTTADQSYAGNITGNGAVVKTNANTLSLTGVNTFTNGFVVKAGKVYSSNPVGFENPVTGFGASTNPVTLGDTGSSADATIEIGGTWVSMSQPVTVVGSGSRMLRGTWSNGGQVQNFGSITLSSADVRLQQTSASPLRYVTSGITGTGNVIITNTSSGGTDLRSSVNNAGYVRNDSTGSGGIDNQANANTFGANVTSLIQNSATSGWVLRQADASFAGTVQVLQGSMFVVNAAALNSNNVASVASGATLDIQNVDEIIAGFNNVSGSGGMVTDSTGSSLHTLTLGGAGNYSFGGNITAASPANRALTVNLQPGGVQTLSGASTYTGTTTINGGTLALTGSASLASVNYSIGGGAKLDVSGLSSTFTLGSGQTLTGSSGTGIIAGNFNLNSGSSLVLNYTNGTPTLNVLNGVLTLSSGDSVTVNVSGTQLPSGSFKLVSKGTGGSVNGTLPASVTLGGAGAAASASLQLTSGELFLVVGSSVNTNAFTMTNSVSNGTLTLSWPADHTGYRLQAQTNSLSIGLGSNWVDVANSTATNQMSFPVNPANGSVFYRLVYP